MVNRNSKESDVWLLSPTPCDLIYYTGELTPCEALGYAHSAAYLV